MTPRDKTAPEVAYNVVGDRIGDDREQLLHFPNDEDLADVSTQRHGNVVVGSVQQFFRWCQLSSIWPVSFGLACCAIEMMSAAGTRYDLDRFGAGAMRGTPRQSDLMIVSGTVTAKMATRLKRLYDQMPEPKWVIAMGSCAIGGGPYFKHGYHVLKGVDLMVPVDVYVPGCPPRPEVLLDGLLRLQDKIRGKKGRLVKPKWIDEYITTIPD
jgi:NADH-quinone oxidoreductase subunit B